MVLGMSKTEKEINELEEKKKYFESGMKREPTVEELDIAIRVNKSSWAEYCKKMISSLDSQIRIMKNSQRNVSIVPIGLPAIVPKKEYPEDARNLFNQGKRNDAAKLLMKKYGYSGLEVEQFFEEWYKENPNKSFFINENNLLPPAQESHTDQEPYQSSGIKRVADWGKNKYQQTVSEYHSSTEDRRIPKAVAWAKKELDNRAKKIETKDADRAKKYMEKRRKDLGFDRLADELKKMGEEKRKLEERKKQFDDPKNAEYLKVLSIDLASVEKSIQEKSSAFDEINVKLIGEMQNQDFSSLYNEILGKVPEVLEETVKRFSLSAYGRNVVSEALSDFAKAEAAELVNKAKTIYSGTFNRASRNVGSFFDWWETSRFMDIIFSPITAGLVLAVGLAWISSLEIGTESLYDWTYIILLCAMILVSALAARKARW